MNTSELENALNVLLRYNEHNEISCYVIAANELKNLSIRSYPAMIIQNCDPIGKPGSHWIAYVAYENGTCEYFDSYGNPVYKYNVQVPGKIVNENCRVLQSATSETCGEFCLYFIYHRAIGISYNKIINKFSSRSAVNDRKVKKFVASIAFCLNNTNTIGDCQNCVTQIKNQFQ